MPEPFSAFAMSAIEALKTTGGKVTNRALRDAGLSGDKAMAFCRLLDRLGLAKVEGRSRKLTAPLAEVVARLEALPQVKEAIARGRQRLPEWFRVHWDPSGWFEPGERLSREYVETLVEDYSYLVPGLELEGCDGGCHYRVECGKLVRVCERDVSDRDGD